MVERELARAFKRAPGDSGPARPLHLVNWELVAVFMK
jgi:hypothetical protein